MLKILFMTGFFTLIFIPAPSLAVLQDSRNINHTRIQEIQTFDDLPIGTIIPWTSNSPIPRRKWLPCDGSSVPGGSEYALLRAIIGTTTPRYNVAPEDNMYGVFLRGSRNPRLGIINADTTESHIHKQEAHTHGFNLEVANNYLEGETLSAQYNDGKRGWGSPLSSPSELLWGFWKDADRTKFPGIPSITELTSELENQPAEQEIKNGKENWNYDRPVYSETFEQVKNNPDISDNINISYAGMDYTTKATVRFTGYTSPQAHSTVIGETCYPEKCEGEGEAKVCTPAYCVDVLGIVTCSGVNFDFTKSVKIKDVTVDDPDFLIRSHPSSNFLGTEIDKEYKRGAGWAAYGISDTMNESGLKDVRLTKTNVIGQLNKNGGDDSSDGINNSDGQETMPANVTVRYIIKALP